MKSFYYRHQNGYLLAPVYAKTEEEAKKFLPTQHSWCQATISNTKLERIEKDTEWEKICNS